MVPSLTFEARQGYACSRAALVKRILQVLGVLAVVLTAVSVAVSFFFDVDFYRPRLEARLSRALARDVKFGKLTLSIFSRRVVADDLSISEDPAFGPNPFLKAKSVGLRVDLASLVFSRRLSVTAVAVDQPVVVLLQDAAGKWNISSLGAKGPSAKTISAASSGGSADTGMDFSARKITIADGRLSLGQKPYVVDKVNLDVDDFALASAFPFSVSADIFGGTFEFKGKAGPIAGDDLAATPANATFTAKNMDLAKAPTDLGGLVSVDGSVNLDGHIAHLKAHGKGEKLKLVQGGSPAEHPVELDCALDHNIAAQTGTLTQGDVKTGRALVRFSGPYNIQNKGQLNVRIDVIGEDMPLADLAALMPAVNAVLPGGASIRGGRASVRLTVEGDAEQLVTKGTLSAAGVSFSDFDLGSKLSTLGRFAGIRTGPNTEIQHFSTGVLSSPVGTSLDNIKLFVTGIGQISGDGTIASTRQVNFKMRANLNSAEVSLATLGRGASAGVPFTITGTASNPIFKADVRGIVSEDLEGIPGARRVPSAATGLLKGLLGGKKQK